MHRDVQAADRMLVRLSDLLRMALDRRSAQEVPLTDDLEFLGKYLEIEQARFGDRLGVRFDIDPETLDALVPNLLLQPLVENSVRHAVAARSEGGFVEVTSRRAGDVLELKVRDNGPGLPKERAPSPPARPGAGQHALTARTPVRRVSAPPVLGDPGGGLTVTVVIPFRRDRRPSRRSWLTRSLSVRAATDRGRVDAVTARGWHVSVVSEPRATPSNTTSTPQDYG